MDSIIQKITKIELWILLGLSVVIPVQHVVKGTVSPVSLVFYIVSGYLCWRILLPYPLPLPRPKKSDTAFLIGITLFHLGSLALVSSVPVHFHFDEFIVAYTSMTLPSLTNINWFGVFPGSWVAQFPLLFYILQKPFLMINPTVWAVRLSTWPYSIGIIVYLYWLTSTFINKQYARIAVLLHVLFAPTIYINSMGLHFISSEFFYLAAITHLILYLTTKTKTHLFPLSLFITSSYLTYTGSYITFPVVILITCAALFSIKKQKIQVGIDIGKSFLVAFILFLPFLTFHFTHTPFLTVRTDQVNLYNGTWGETQEQLKSGTSFFTILTKQTVTAMKSLVLPNIGGLGGYDYGHMPLFRPLAILLLIVGCIQLLFFLRGREFRIGLAMLAIMGIPFILGFILTTHPPPFHRIAIIYPFFSLISALPVFLLYKYMQRFPMSFRHTIVSIIIVFYGLFSLFQIIAMIRRDRDIVTWDTPRISEYILKHIPSNTPVYIAADPLFHYKQELPFRLGKAYPIVLNDLGAILETYSCHGPLIINRASEEYLTQLRKLCPTISFVTKLENRPLKDVTIAIPEDK